MKTIYKSLADLQQEVPVILKDTSGFGYKYADLPAILETINPLLKKYSLGFTQLINGTKLKTILFHIESGETIESETDMPVDSLVYELNEKGKSVLKGFEGMNKAQAIGSLITYFRRYALSSMLGLVTDKDTDGTKAKNIINDEEDINFD
ncbi:MAG: ERF family protein [Minisyncoccia bacterium]